MEDGTSTSVSHSDVTDHDPYDARQWIDDDCETRQILDRIAGKWSLMTISLLARETKRFSQLQREIDGISQRMLTVTLRQLERDGLVERTVYPEVPPRVEYALTELGCTLLETIQELVRWTDEHTPQIAEARAAYDQRRSS